jgi:hypothetical protein
VVFETFREPSEWWVSQLEGAKPNAMNGRVQVQRYRITVELIDDPDGDAERLQKLWDECSNSHHFGPLRKEAQRLGVTFKPNSLGRKARERKGY